MTYMKKTKEELIELLQEAEQRGIDTFHELLEVRGKLNAKVDSMGGNKPWKLVALSGSVCGFVGFVLGVMV